MIGGLYEIDWLFKLSGIVKITQFSLDTIETINDNVIVFYVLAVFC